MMRPLLCALLLLMPLSAQALSIEGEVRWQGQLTQKETVRVEPGATLIIAPGTTVTFTGGILEVAGQLQATRARLTGKNWEGIVLKGTDSKTHLLDCTIEGAKTGIQVLGGAPRLDGVRVTGNQVGMELRQKTQTQISRCSFSGNAKVGLFVKDGSSPSVTKSRFEGNGKFGAYLFGSAPLEFSNNLFLNNATGVMVTHFGSEPVLRNNRFENNATAIQVDRAARPLLAGNTFSNNGTGIQLSRRSDPKIEGNRLSGNQIGIFVSYSSYPQIQSNDLDGNAKALVLDHQSSSWDEANGAAAREEEASRGAFGKTPRQSVSESDRRPRAMNATVEATGNWWGHKGTQELVRIGPTGNPSFIVDGRDNPTFTDNGVAYPLDKVRFSPWSSGPTTKGTIK